MRRFWIAAPLCVLALVGLSLPASAAGVQRPFQVTLTGATTDIVYAPGFDFGPNWTVTSTFGDRCPGGASWLITDGGTGYGTHLGAFTWSDTHCTRVTSVTPPDGVIFAGREQFAAANGDILYETFEPAAGGITPEGDLLCADTVATFAGGTGRFLHATGGALEHGCWPASSPGPVTAYLIIKSSGTITYDAADRS